MNHLESLTLADIVAILKRRQALFINTASAILLIALIVAFSMVRYSAVATIEIQQPYIPSSVTGDNALDTMYGLADRRIRQVEQTVTSTESLASIIKKHELYPSSSAKPEQLAAGMRRDIKLEFINGSIANPAAVQKESVEQLSAQAFTLRFKHRDSALAKAGLDALVEAFVEQEATLRRAQARETDNFIDEELITLKASIAEQEKQIADFRSEHGDAGPEARTLREQGSTSNRSQLESLQTQLSTTQASIGTLRGQLAATDPYLPLVENGTVMRGAAGQLRTLKAQLATISGRYGPKHPDVLRLRDQIAALKKSGAKTDQVEADADNPVYLQLSQQLAAATGLEQSLQTQLEKLQERQDKYDSETFNSPEVEKEYSKLTLDLDNTKERYRMLMERKLAASMKKNLESAKYSDRLHVLHPAEEPGHTRPRRSLVLLLGILFASIGGALTALLADLMSGTVRNARHLASIIGTAPLITIPSMTRGNV